MTKTEHKVIAWAGERGIFRESTPLDQALKAQEEISELLYELNCIEILKNRKGAIDLGELHSLQDKAIMEAGDVLVCLVNLLWMLNSTIDTSLKMAYGKIKDRKGEMKDGFFVKDEE